MLGIVVLLFSISSIQAQKLTVQVSANKVQVGAAFQVVLTLMHSLQLIHLKFKDFDVFSDPLLVKVCMNGAMSASFLFHLIAAKRRVSYKSTNDNGGEWSEYFENLDY